MKSVDALDGAIVGGLAMLGAGLFLWFGLGVALTVLGALLLAAGAYGSLASDRRGR